MSLPADDRPYVCPGCDVRYTMPPPPERLAIDLSCKHCGHKDTRLHPTRRVCESCGICGICGAAHTVMVRGPVRR